MQSEIKFPVLFRIFAVCHLIMFVVTLFFSVIFLFDSVRRGELADTYVSGLFLSCSLYLFLTSISWFFASRLSYIYLYTSSLAVLILIGVHFYFRPLSKLSEIDVAVSIAFFSMVALYCVFLMVSMFYGPVKQWVSDERKNRKKWSIATLNVFVIFLLVPAVGIKVFSAIKKAEKDVEISKIYSADHDDEFPGINSCDRDNDSYFRFSRAVSGQHFMLEFKEETTLSKIAVSQGKFEIPDEVSQIKRLLLEFSNGEKKAFDFKKGELDKDINLEGVKTKTVKFIVEEVFEGTDFADVFFAEVSPKKQVPYFEKSDYWSLSNEPVHVELAVKNFPVSEDDVESEFEEDDSYEGEYEIEQESFMVGFFQTMEQFPVMDLSSEIKHQDFTDKEFPVADDFSMRHYLRKALQLESNAEKFMFYEHLDLDNNEVEYVGKVKFDGNGYYGFVVKLKLEKADYIALLVFDTEKALPRGHLILAGEVDDNETTTVSSTIKLVENTIVVNTEALFQQISEDTGDGVEISESYIFNLEKKEFEVYNPD